MKDIIILTHNDLDGVSAGWVAEKYFVAKSVLSSSYTDIRNKLEHIFTTYGKIDLVITDLHIEPMDLKYALDNFYTVKMFDHHAQTEKYHGLPKIDNRFELYYDESRSATKIVADYAIENHYTFTDIEIQYINQVNMFDMWKHKERLFPFARMANDLYWKDKFFKFLGKLRSSGAPDIPNGLSKDELQFCRDNFERIANVKDTAEWMSTEYGSTIVFLDESEKSAINFIPQLMSETSETGIFYIIYRGFNKYMCSVRVDDTDEPDFEMGNTMKKFANNQPMIISAGGHHYAGAMSFKSEVTLKDAVTLIDKLEEAIHPKKNRDFWDDDIPF